jgi:SAM-dependent methyltransferase
MTAALPPREVSAHLSEALAPMRARLLRRASIAHRASVLDLGAGWGLVQDELVRRSRGAVVGLDRDPDALRALGPRGVRGDATELPFGEGQFDLVFCQQVLMWTMPLDRVMSEIRRVLRPSGVLVALEPDFGGMLEHPPEIAIASVWRAALTRAGADPQVGRKLGPAAARAGFTIACDLLPVPGKVHPRRADLLDGLPLTDGERAALARARKEEARLAPSACFVHLPFVCVTATVG